ncbi:MAG: hypothetical protein ACPGTG_06870 [Flavobacteriales bacterium]
MMSIKSMRQFIQNKVTFVFSIFLILSLLSCQSSEPFFTVRYGMLTDQYSTFDHIKTIQKDGGTEVIIELRKGQRLKIELDAPFEDLSRKDFKTAHYSVWRPNGDKSLELVRLKKIKFKNGKLTKWVNLTAWFSHGRNNLLAVEGYFPIRVGK